MIRRLSITQVLKIVIEQVERVTHKRCYDAVPKDAPAPFYFIEVTNVTPKNTKSILVDQFNLYVHCIAEANPSSVPVNALIEGLQEALTERLYLPDPFDLIRIVDNGVIIIKTDETGEKHAVVSISIEIAYGYICK